MKKKPLIIIIVLVIVVVVGYFSRGLIKETLKKVPGIPGSGSSGEIPSINVSANPLEKAPEINPVEKVNPFKDVKTNPFE